MRQLARYYDRKCTAEKLQVQRLVEDIISEFLFACVCRGSCVRLTRDLIDERMLDVCHEVTCTTHGTVVTY